MEKYKSKQVKIARPAEAIYALLSDFGNFTPILRDRVEEWTVDGDACSFRFKGFTVRLRMVEKVPFDHIKITGDDSPFEFFFWIQLKEVSPNDTRLMLTAHMKLNMMMKMMIGGKIEPGLDRMAEQIAAAFNSAPI